MTVYLLGVVVTLAIVLFFYREIEKTKEVIFIFSLLAILWPIFCIIVVVDWLKH